MPFSCITGKQNDEEKQRRKQHKKIEEDLLKDRRKYKATQRLLLLGQNSNFVKRDTLYDD